MKMQKDFDRLRELVAQWIREIELSSKQSLTDKHKYSEFIAVELLNAAFHLDLKPLKKNSPAIDLGDLKKGIAFQVTSRTDAGKIHANLSSFLKHNKISDYPNGMRFLLLANEKENWRKETIESFNRLLPGFDGVNHIYTLPDVLNELEVHYIKEKDRFYELLAVMEWQFGNKSGEPPVRCLKQILFEGSREYYQNLTRANGRFHLLHIEDVLLARAGTGESKRQWLAQPVSMDGEKKDKEDTVITLLPRLWERGCVHAAVVSEGGMGKTVSLVRLWDIYLESVCAVYDEPIPIFLQLNEFNHRLHPAGEFILSRIARYYLNDETFTTSLRKLFKIQRETAEGMKVPSIVLLLDGFNEITVERKDLLIEINHLVEQCPGIQFIMTSRSDMRSTFNWSNWNLVMLDALDEEKVTRYLKERGTKIPEAPQLLTLLKTPMMLTLYAATSEIQDKLKDSQYCCFKERVETTGELLWNFMEAQVGNLRERLGQDLGQVYYYTFLLKFFLPALGFEMEKVGLFDFTQEQMDENIDRICRHFGQPDFLEKVNEFDEYIDRLPIGEKSNAIDRKKRRGEIRTILTDVLHLMVKEGESFRFLHQNFRNFFAAVHILNEMEVGIKKKEIPVVLKEQRLDFYIRRMVGEIEGEHYAKPYIDETEKAWRIDIKENRLFKALELCRGKFNKESNPGEGVAKPVLSLHNTQSLAPVLSPGVQPPHTYTHTSPIGYAVWNIVTIWKEVRGELTGADLSRLDLTGIVLNGVRCSRFYGNSYFQAKFNNSRIHEITVFPQSHISKVAKVVCSIDGEKLLTASINHTILEWNTKTGDLLNKIIWAKHNLESIVYTKNNKIILSSTDDGSINKWDLGNCQYLSTLKDHTDSINNLNYRLEEEKFLSASSDCKIKEWDSKTDKCIKTFTGHLKRVNSAIYSPDKKRVLSASSDCTIKVWDLNTTQNLDTFTGHKSGVMNAVYSKDGRRILSASADNTIKEWCSITGHCLRTLSGHTSTVNLAIYSPDEKRILSASDDHTIKVWDVESGECIKTFTGHTDYVKSVEYSPNGEKIYSASYDGTIKEWDAESGECLRILGQKTASIYGAILSPDMTRILHVSDDGSIKEWNIESNQCVRIFTVPKNDVKSIAYSIDGSRIQSVSHDNTFREWNAKTGECIIKITDDNTSNDDENYKSFIKSYEQGDEDSNEKISSNKNFIYLLDSSGKKKKEFINVPGLFIQGCSFLDLEPGSVWTEEGLRIMRMYGAQISVKGKERSVKCEE